MIPQTCAIAGCDRPLHGRTWCNLHYRRELYKRRTVNPCACGCGKLCRYEFVTGHNTRLLTPAEQKRRGDRNDGDALRDTGFGVSYRKLHSRHEHRVVMEQKLGRPLRKGEVVHHVNGNHRDNRPENLQVMTQAEHARIHSLEYWKARRAGA